MRRPNRPISRYCRAKHQGPGAAVHPQAVHPCMLQSASSAQNSLPAHPTRHNACVQARKAHRYPMKWLPPFSAVRPIRVFLRNAELLSQCQPALFFRPANHPAIYTRPAQDSGQPKTQALPKFVQKAVFSGMACIRNAALHRVQAPDWKGPSEAWR